MCNQSRKRSSGSRAAMAFPALPSRPAALPSGGACLRHRAALLRGCPRRPTSHVAAARHSGWHLPRLAAVLPSQSQAGAPCRGVRGRRWIRLPRLTVAFVVPARIGSVSGEGSSAGGMWSAPIPAAGTAWQRAESPGLSEGRRGGT